MLDPRIGSGELLASFKPYDVDVEVVQLDAADIAHAGNGPDGPCLVGYERKIVTDLVASMRSDRLSGSQLSRLLEQYQFPHIIVEGIWQAGDNGEIEVRGGAKHWIPLRVGSRSVLYREVDHYLATLENRVGVNVVRTSNKAQTVAYLVSRYKWWNDKEWDKHDSFKAIYNPPVPRQPGRVGFSMPQPGPVEQFAAILPGIREKAWAAGKKFDTIHDMVNASQKELSGVDGIGKVLAERIWKWLRTNPRASKRAGWDDERP